MVSEKYITKTAKLLEQRVIADGRKLDVGLLGSKTILNALSENGYADLAYELASSDKYPSWGYWIANGATTLYEGWEAGSVGKKLPYSLNHIMFGEISAWMYKALGGIKTDPSQPGFKNVLVEPHFVKGLDSFSCSYKCRCGTVKSALKRDAGKIVYTITLPRKVQPH
jgi:alpha-L-rhamnosidase